MREVLRPSQYLKKKRDGVRRQPQDKEWPSTWGRTSHIALDISHKVPGCHLLRTSFKSSSFGMPWVH